MVTPLLDLEARADLAFLLSELVSYCLHPVRDYIQIQRAHQLILDRFCPVVIGEEKEIE